MNIDLRLGNCIDVMATLPENSIDTIITDPPYHLTSIVKRFGGKNAAPAKFGTDGVFARASKGFMGKTWDGGSVAFEVETWERAYHVLKPGGLLLAFGGTRTYHRLACAIEDAGFEIRDTIAWVYGSGFPKSLNIEKAGAGADWHGWGTALKPAFEPIVVAMKPPDGTFVNNALTWGAAGLNIDGGRVDGEPIPINRLEEWSGFGEKDRPKYKTEVNSNGRFPANFIHDGSNEVADLFPNDAQRFFYCAKASRSERNAGLEGMPDAEVQRYGSIRTNRGNGYPDATPMQNHHPTVKPLALMRYLARLTSTPTGGTVLDPFMGSGTTGVACVKEGRSFIGIELDEGYLEIAKKRIEHAQAECAQLSIDDLAEE